MSATVMSPRFRFSDPLRKCLGVRKSKVQKIGVNNIDPCQLANKLDVKFGKGFKLQLVHGVYTITAPKRLSEEEINECRFQSIDPTPSEKALQRRGSFKNQITTQIKRLS